jgi:hypothetical protein
MAETEPSLILKNRVTRRRLLIYSWVGVAETISALAVDSVNQKASRSIVVGGITTYLLSLAGEKFAVPLGAGMGAVTYILSSGKNALKRDV